MPKDFNELPRQNEKNEALDYVRALIDQARIDGRNEDVVQLDKIIKLLNRKKYGLVWEEHAELVEEEMKTRIPVFIEDETRKIRANPEDKDYNFLLEGDNLHSLHLLEKTHAGRIDVIYIDPPYNTGNKDFKYNDKFVDKTDGYAHSKWLSFMSKRLEIARRLLSDSGVIFISIDDNEQAQLKLLCDEVFGEKNFLSQFIVENNPKGRKNSNFTSVTSEYCLAYSKNREVAYFVENIPKSSSDMRLDEEGNYVHNSGRRVVVGKNNFNKLVSNFLSEKHYSLYFRKQDRAYRFIKEINIDELNYDLSEQGFIRYISHRDGEFVENTYTQNKLEELIHDNVLDFTDDKIYEKNLRSTIRIKNLLINRKYEAIIDNKKQIFEIDLKTTSAKQQLAQLFGGESPFDYPKNLGLIRLLLTLNKRKNIVVLDFFAGSGTTGHAVAQLNKEDGGNRKYILCTNNENYICEEVTYKRLTNIQDDLPHNLKYFKTKFLSKDDEDLENTLLHHVQTLIELEHGIDLKESDKATAFSLSELRKLDLSGIKTIYVRQQSHAMMEKSDLVRFEGIELIDVPEYYFAKEMREAGI
ncbi:TPA: site-specific DNA-methyltransferase [Streptococcus suis]|uniref:site-specific DNA-methyltransferase n=1 Tax=Streptococcus TaxID=1301 RepID=UPI000403CF07|nr:MULTISPECIES: site-specific DNA-methyltransferase [Streptococcus]AXI68013.1 site-specific DNA-methyltransferase [Streptococcus suis]MBL6439816.1 site-specific DNA-methyltransferase [Streptococcus suis]MBL6504598.1 site-specific DNA-methyltransferase [Streptococcus suis]MBM0242574.1 site-specific DNA-methyltransferase [Streptococcus suis]MBM7134956.1 site-specific DNA-methyltransferase [Streptococcus suis]